MGQNRLYIAPQEPQSGTTVVVMGIMEHLKGRVDNIAYFAPIVKEPGDTRFFLNYFDLQMQEDESYGYTLHYVESMISKHRFDEVLEGLIHKVQILQERYDYIIFQGLFRSSFSASLDFDINLEIAKNFNAPFIRVLNAKSRSLEEIEAEITIAHETMTAHGCLPAATFINRVEPGLMHTIHQKYSTSKQSHPLYFLPEVDELDMPTIGEVAQNLQCQQILGDPDELHRIVKQSKVAAMTLENFINYLEDGDLIIVPGDRSDILLTTIMANYSDDFPSISGILLTGGLIPDEKIIKLINGITGTNFPIFSIDCDTYSAAMRVKNIPARINIHSDRKIALAMGLFTRHTDLSEIDSYIQTQAPLTMTPTMFKYKLFDMARKDLKNIVLPESEDERILKAAEILLRREVVKVTLLGNPETVKNSATALGLNLEKAAIVDPASSSWIDLFSQQFYDLRKHKGFRQDHAEDTIKDPLYFATMMVYNGYADGMVCGASHTTQETIRPALQIIKTRPGISVVSSIFFMCLETKVLVYGDCAVNQDPDAQVLSDIALSSAQTAQTFGIEPKVAMLSYSTGSSGKGDDVEKVRQATEIFKERNSEWAIEGPIQYDAAIDPAVAKQKLPGSKVAGQATLFIFPDLNTGNNTYKAVQRSANAVAIGPILQGLKKPVNDLSRGCNIEDIVNTVAITAIQAQESE